MEPKKISTLKHPTYLACESDWAEWRLCYKGGDDFVRYYLEKFSRRETNEDFNLRRKMTPIPTHAKAAINDIRNSIFQRMSEINRTGGSSAYQAAVKGQGLGVDNRGSSMTAFIGQNVLEDLLVIGKCGIYIDAPARAPRTLKGATEFKPYLYSFSPEDILSWKRGYNDDPSAFTAVLLREVTVDYDDTFGLPAGEVQRYRYVWINPQTGLVNVQLYDENTQPLGEPVELQLTRIPFVMLDLRNSLMRDIAKHQIALLNLWSSNVAYGVVGSFPIYTEQRDLRGGGDHLKKSSYGDGSEGGEGEDDNSIEVGTMKGRVYDADMERPGFINPSAEPLKGNLELCGVLKDDIRALVNLAVSNLATQASAESKVMDNQGLESGLSFIGLVLEAGERQIAKHWAAYESSVEKEQKVATVTYPERWSLKSTEQKIAEATELHTLAKSIPGQTIKREACKLVVNALFGTKLPQDVIDRINKEIDSAPYTTSDPEIIKMAKEQGLVGDHTGSVALGFNDSEAAVAKKDHIDRLKRIAEAQSEAKEVNGVRDTQGSPGVSDREAKAKQRDTTTKPTTEKPVRGKGK